VEPLKAGVEEQVEGALGVFSLPLSLFSTNKLNLSCVFEVAHRRCEPCNSHDPSKCKEQNSSPMPRCVLDCENAGRNIVKAGAVERSFTRLFPVGKPLGKRSFFAS